VQGLNSLAITVHGPYVYIDFAGANSRCAAALFQKRIDQRADVFVGRLAMRPDPVQLVIDAAGQAESSPDPMRCGVFLFYLDHANRAVLACDDGVKKFRVRDWKE